MTRNAKEIAGEIVVHGNEVKWTNEELRSAIEEALKTYGDQRAAEMRERIAGYMQENQCGEEGCTCPGPLTIRALPPPDGGGA